MVWSECQRQGSSSDAESRKFSDHPVKKVDPGRNDPSGNPELSIWLIYGGKSVDDRGPSRSCLWCGIFIVGGPELCESRLATSGCSQPPAETLIVSAAMGIGILSGRVLSALFEEPNKVCTRPRHFCDVSPTDLSILSPSQLSKRCHQAGVQTGKQRIVEPGYTDGDHTVSPEPNTALGHRPAKPPLFAREKRTG